MARIVAAHSAFDIAIDVLHAKDVVALPTETVYGLAADALDDDAVKKIYAAKNRPAFNPLIALVSSLEQAAEMGRWSPLANRLATAFWPGPLTLVLERRTSSAVSNVMAAGLPTVAMRMPRGFALDLTCAYGKPLAAPSANLSGRVSATTPEIVAALLGNRIPLIVDGGPSAIGLESTIIKIEHDELRLLRPGAIPHRVLEAALDLKVNIGATQIEAPGMMASHYAPVTLLRLNATSVGETEALLSFGGDLLPGEKRCRKTLNLSPGGNLEEAATNLFCMLDELDRCGARAIAVARVPDEGLGISINDRLARASVR